MMRIGFDMISAGSGFSPTAGGMPRYYEGLLRGLVDLPTVSSVVAFVPPWDDGLAIPNNPKMEVVRCRGLTHNRISRVLYEQTVLPMKARRRRVDVLLSTCNVRPLVRRAPSVVVLQSMQSFILPDRIGRLRRAYLRQVVPRSLASADVVITVTDAERQDAIRLFSLAPDRVVTVHHGASSWAIDAARVNPIERPPPAGVTPPYVLTVSRLYGLKNHRRLIQAFAMVAKTRPVEHDLIIVGGDADVRKTDLEEVAAREGVSKRVRFLGAVPQEDLPGLLANADVIAYVSLYETFGLPVLEACAFGRPLVTSNVGGTAEVAGDAARLVDPWKVESIAEGLAAALLDEGLRQRLSRLGPLRAAKFTWAKCAQETVTALELAMDRSTDEGHGTGGWIRPRRGGSGRPTGGPRRRGVLRRAGKGRRREYR